VAEKLCQLKKKGSSSVPEPYVVISGNNHINTHYGELTASISASECSNNVAFIVFVGNKTKMLWTLSSETDTLRFLCIKKDGSIEKNLWSPGTQIDVSSYVLITWFAYQGSSINKNQTVTLS